jgi:hypothetical protein
MLRCHLAQAVVLGDYGLGLLPGFTRGNSFPCPFRTLFSGHGFEGPFSTDFSSFGPLLSEELPYLGRQPFRHNSILTGFRSDVKNPLTSIGGLDRIRT